MPTDAPSLWKFARSLLLSNVRARRMAIVILALIPISILLFNMFPTVSAGAETPLRASIIVRNRLLALLGIICLFSLLATWISAEWVIMKRKRRIVAAAARLRAGDFYARTDIVHDSRGTDELATIFNTLAKALQERQQENVRLMAETQKFNEELEQRVVRRTHQLQASNAELLASQAELRRLSQQIMDVTEQERTRISREIHDQLGQRLTVIKLEVQMAQRRLPPQQSQISERLDKVTGFVDETIQTVRRIAADLRPGILDDFGLGAATEWQLEEFGERTGIHCQLSVHLDEEMLDPDLATATFRILREALTNVARHAQASAVDVTLHNDATSLTLILQDNGRGITSAEQGNPNKLGLLGMRERARQFGGTVTLQGVPNRGTTVTVKLPLHPIPIDASTSQHGNPEREQL